MRAKALGNLRIVRNGGIAVLLATAIFSGCGGGGSGDGGVVIPAFDLPTSVEIADLNEDGVQDLIVAASRVAGAPPHPGFVSVLTQVGGTPGAFGAPVRYAAGADPHGLVVADLVGDGHRLDAVVANAQLRAGDIGSNVISVLHRDPAKLGAFLPPVAFSVAVRNPNAIAVGDVDGDGRPDLVVASSAAPNVASVLIFLRDAQAQFVATSSLAPSGGSNGVAVGDLDRDGRQDIVVTSSNRVVVFLQDAAQAGEFLPGVGHAVGLQPIGVRLGDLNGDGLSDLAVSNLGAPDGSGSSVSVLLQDPGSPGTFAPATSYATDIFSEGIVIADLNGDDRADLAVANFGSFGKTGSVSVLLQGAAAGSFSAAVNYRQLGGSNALAVGDLNQDGRPDIAVVDDGGVAVLYQNPLAPGSFLAPVRLGI